LGDKSDGTWSHFGRVGSLMNDRYVVFEQETLYQNAKHGLVCYHFGAANCQLLRDLTVCVSQHHEGESGLLNRPSASS
ncbi:hypothetical protein AVEN_159632-1, partial [Araneus ventricosus]